MLLDRQKIRVFEEFLRDYNARLTGSYIAKKKNLNQKTVSNILKEAEKLRFFKKTTQGKNKLYYLNLEDNETIINFISAVEHFRTIDFYRRKPLIKEALTKILPYCRGIVAVFGSFAKNTEKKDSDLDVFVAGRYNKEKIEEVSELYNVEINVKNYPLKILRKVRKNKDFFLEEVIKDHIIVGNVPQFVLFAVGFQNGQDQMVFTAEERNRAC